MTRKCLLNLNTGIRLVADRCLFRLIAVGEREVVRLLLAVVRQHRRRHMPMFVIAHGDPDDARGVRIHGHTVLHDVASRFGDLVPEGLAGHFFRESTLRKLETHIAVGDVGRLRNRVALAIHRHGLGVISLEVTLSIGVLGFLCGTECLDNEIEVAVFQRVVAVAHIQNLGALDGCGCRLWVVHVVECNRVAISTRHGAVSTLVHLNHRVGGVLKVSLGLGILDLIGRRQAQRTVAVVDDDDVHTIDCRIIVDAARVHRSVVVVGVVIHLSDDVAILTRFIEDDLAEGERRALI